MFSISIPPPNDHHRSVGAQAAALADANTQVLDATDKLVMPGTFVHTASYCQSYIHLLVVAQLTMC